jgi:S-adenosylmethionine-diacylgycerolhomoserine-N-methlytransferase
MTSPSVHREIMSGYYAWQSRIYDATRWTFLFGRDAILDRLQLNAGDTVVEVGCGTGRNLQGILKRIGTRGEVFAVDCAAPMLARCTERLRKERWNNVHLVDREYGSRTVTGGTADVVLMSYSLSMIPPWESVIECARQELRPGGKIGVVDFCVEGRSVVSRNFDRWMTRNHVAVGRPYVRKLSSLFRPLHCSTRKAFGGLWSYYSFVGERTDTVILDSA